MVAAVAVLVAPALLYTALLGHRLAIKQEAEDNPITLVAVGRESADGDGAGAKDGATKDGSEDETADATTRAPLTAHAEFTSVFAKDENYIASEDFTWDDTWFFADPADYSHDLARACASLSSVANAESEHFMMVGDTPDYMLDVLSQLGFEHATTSTYEHRSAIVDQIAELIKPAGGDVTAYTIASKHIKDPLSGQEKILVIAVLRGTYGPEWLSNLRAGVAEGKASQANTDHAGFSAAAQGLVSDVVDYIDAIRELRPDDKDAQVSLLLCGHSRGGAVANLAAASFDDAASGTGADNGLRGEALAADGVDAVYAYTFATPGTTRNGERGDARYDNIFNICNPADLITQTPLASWGYGRYGRTLWLPEQGSAGFDRLFEDVRRRFYAIDGCETGADPADAATVREITKRICEAAPTIEDFSTPGGVLGVVKAVASHDLVRLIQSHSPELYFSWLQAIDAAGLSADE